MRVLALCFAAYTVLVLSTACTDYAEHPELIKNAMDIDSLTQSGGVYVSKRTGQPFTGPVETKTSSYSFMYDVSGYMQDGYFASKIEQRDGNVCAVKIRYGDKFFVFRSNYFPKFRSGMESRGCGACESWNVGEGTLVGDLDFAFMGRILTRSDLGSFEFARSPNCQPAWSDARSSAAFEAAVLKISSNREEGERILRSLIPAWAMVDRAEEDSNEAEPEAEEQEPAAEPGHNGLFTIVLFSEVEKKSAEKRAEDVRKAGFDAELIESSSYSSLRSGYWIVMFGQYYSTEQASDDLRQLRAAGFRDAYVRQLSNAR